jgi:type II secretory pathway pseudopilin PulG
MKPLSDRGRRDAGAFTLVETLMAIFVGVLAAILLFRSVVFLSRSESRESSLGDARQEAARLLSWMRRDLRSASGFETTTSGFSVAAIELDSQARPVAGRVLYEPVGNRWLRRGAEGNCETFAFPSPEVSGQPVSVRMELAGPATARCRIVLGSGPGNSPFELSETVLMGARDPDRTGRGGDDGSGEGGTAP